MSLSKDKFPLELKKIFFGFKKFLTNGPTQKICALVKFFGEIFLKDWKDMTYNI